MIGKVFNIFPRTHLLLAPSVSENIVERTHLLLAPSVSENIFFVAFLQMHYKYTIFLAKCQDVS